MNNWIFRLEQLSQKESAWVYLLKLVYLIFRSNIFTSLILFVTSCFWIPYILQTTTPPITLWDAILAIKIPLLVSSLTIIMSQICVTYKERNLMNLAAAKHSLKAIATITHGWTQRIETLVRDTLKSKDLIGFQERFSKHTDYNQRADYICGILYRVLKTIFRTEYHQVSIMHRGKDQDGDFIKMIAYKNDLDEMPKSFNKKFYLYKEDFSNYFHVKYFSSRMRGAKTFTNMELINKNLYINPDIHERELNLKQFIAIPIIDTTMDVVSLIQIDTTCKNQFGKTEKEVLFFIDNFLRPICNFLKVWYQKDELSTALEECC